MRLLMLTNQTKSLDECQFGRQIDNTEIFLLSFDMYCLRLPVIFSKYSVAITSSFKYNHTADNSNDRTFG